MQLVDKVRACLDLGELGGCVLTRVMQEPLPLGLGQTRYRRRVVASRPEIFGDQRFFESRLLLAVFRKAL